MSPMVSDLITGFAFGFSCGAGFMWWWFHRNKLIRTREEWSAAGEED